jgi:hypothetical protein
MFVASGLSLTGFSLLGKQVASNEGGSSVFKIGSLSLLLVSFVALFFLAWKSKDW